jgi:hypothetical protein
VGTPLSVVCEDDVNEGLTQHGEHGGSLMAAALRGRSDAKE